LRILHVNAGNLYGGIESMLVALARHRAEVPELEQRFALCFDGRLARELAEAGTPPHGLGRVRVSRPWSVRRARAALVNFLEGARIDAVMCHGGWSHAVFGPVARSRGVRLGAWLHAPPSRRRWLDALASLTSPDLLIANSAFTAAAAHRIFPRTACSVIPCPVDAPSRPDDGSRRRAIRARLGTPDEHVVIVVACRIEPLKGLHVLVEALSHLRHLDGWTCWIAGGAQRPAERRYLASLAARAARGGVGERIHLLGARSDIPELLAAADVYCQPNTAPDAFGIAFVEALDAGLPVVTSPMGGALEILDERCALFSPPTARAVADRLAALIADPWLRARLGGSGPARARALCDPATALHRLASALAGDGAA
jgi:glycosyltransferase involved in cell wall biosynthesis